MGNVYEQIEEIRKKAEADNALRASILATREADEPLWEFCEICRREGYEVYPMDVIAAGDEFYAAMKRSTNGGGENSPVLNAEDDIYELLLASLEMSGRG
ncbi:MAG: hypothetical protein K5840_04390 [Eubacterium sp.]|nr:hypothetical protein [Eubacterium sp.]